MKKGRSDTMSDTVFQRAGDDGESEFVRVVDDDAVSNASYINREIG